MQSEVGKRQEGVRARVIVQGKKEGEKNEYFTVS